MSETTVPYQVNNNLLTKAGNCPTMEMEQVCAPVDPANLERMLIPLLNWARKVQGKKPIIVPKG